MTWHKDLSICTSEDTNKLRTNSFNRNNNLFLKKLKTDIKFKLVNIYNCDEPGCLPLDDCPPGSSGLAHPSG